MTMVLVLIFAEVLGLWVRAVLPPSPIPLLAWGFPAD